MRNIFNTAISFLKIACISFCVVLLTTTMVAAGNSWSSNTAVQSSAVFEDKIIGFKSCQEGQGCVACAVRYKELTGKDIRGCAAHSPVVSSVSCSAASSCTAAAATSMESRNIARAERPFVQGEWVLEPCLKDNRDIKKFFQQLFYTGCNDQDLLAVRWESLREKDKIFRITGRLVMFLYRIYNGRRGQRALFEVLATDPALLWLSEQINKVVLDESVPFEQRKFLSADCAEAYAKAYVQDKGFSEDVHEALVRIIRIFFLPLETVPVFTAG